MPEHSKSATNKLSISSYHRCTLFHCVHVTASHRYRVLGCFDCLHVLISQIVGLRQSCSNLSAPFSQQPLFMFLGHILVILKLFHAFSYYYICHGDFRLMNTDIAILIWGEAPGTAPIQDGDLDKRVCSDCSSQPAVPSSLSLSSGLPIP